MADIVKQIIDTKYEEVKKRNIWEGSNFENISKVENDDVGKIGEKIINDLCKLSDLHAEIDGIQTKQVGGGCGDGIICFKTVEIKTARLGSDEKSFQHELGEVPWNAEYMIFLDISPNKIYITIFKNFTQEFYEESGKNNSIKCEPCFPTKSITWRKLKGAFKLDTTMTINEKNVKNKNTYVIENDNLNMEEFRNYVNSIIPPPPPSE
tara:strand:- start:6073 stop:6696 length:624 start_codon:yes stop_codon:yes gene_type:complete